MYEIDKVLNSNIKWITENYLKVEDKKQLSPALADGEILYRGDVYKFTHTPLLGKAIIVDTEEKIISAGINLSGERLISWYKEQAEFYLPVRTKKLAAIYNYTVAKVSSRQADKRWGSCSSSGNISLNSKLIMAPEWVSDSIIKHELVHTVIMNHGNEFWYALHQICPEWDSAKEWLALYNGLMQKIWKY